MKNQISAFLLAFSLLACADLASAQHAPSQPTATDQQLSRVIAYAQAYRQHLPSLECDEAILSQKVKSGKVKQQVKVKATLREFRDPDAPGGFRDEYTSKSGHAKSVKLDLTGLPYFVYNVFANSLGVGDSPLPACFNYHFTKLDDGKTVQFNIDSKPGIPDPFCKKIPDDYHKTMLIDTASGAVRHVDRHISPDFADKNLEIPNVTIDYAPQKLGDEIFWLPTRFEAIDLHQEGRMVATYSNCHRYTVASKVVIP
jgi:hypothetical protein